MRSLHKLVCPICSIEFHVKSSDRQRRRYCSKECRRKYQQTLIGEKSPGWKGKACNRSEYRQIYEAQLKADRSILGGVVTIDQWILKKNEYGNRCACCRKERQLTIDHAIPTSKGGSNIIDNIQPLCRSCNSKKKDKIIFYFADGTSIHIKNLDEVPSEFMSPNIAKIERLLNITEGKIGIPGIEPYQEKIIASR